jgi:hypothetical protein
MIAISGLYYEEEADKIGTSLYLTFNSGTDRNNGDSPQKGKNV